MSAATATAWFRTHKLLLLKFGQLVIAGAVVTGTSLLSQVSYAAEEGSRWEHNGSIMRLLSDGASRRFAYEKMRSGIASEGVEQGAILFDGKKVQDRYEGSAHYFSRSCGRQTFPVSGSVGSDQRSVVLTGDAPQQDDACRTVGRRQETLSFRLIGKVPAADEDQTDEISLFPSKFASRGYLFEPTTGAKLTLDRAASRGISGDLHDAQGIRTARVTGSNDSPRSLRLEFISPDGKPLGRASYKYLSDQLDSVLESTLQAGSPPLFPSRWVRRDSSGLTPGELRYCEKNCPLSGEPGAVRSTPFDMNSDFQSQTDWSGSGFTRPVEGFLCIAINGRNMQETMAFLKANGLQAKAPKNDHQSCSDAKQKVLVIPAGYEGAYIQKLNEMRGVESVDYVYGPAGGSGLARVTIAEGALLPKGLTIHTAPKMWNEAACKVRTIFQKDFQTVRVNRCPQDQGNFENEFCFTAILEGHTADGKGFTNANLGPGIKDKFLVKSELRFDVMQVKTPFSASGFVERLSYYVVETKFARQPQGAPVATADYRTIEHYRINRSDRDLDEKILGVAQQLVMASDFTCNEP